jgi:hypothetical protein
LNLKSTYNDTVWRLRKKGTTAVHLCYVQTREVAGHVYTSLPPHREKDKLTTL